MTLIDKDALMARIQSEGKHQASQNANRYDPVVLAYGGCYAMAKTAPVIDAVEVVHAGWQSHGDFFTSYLKCPVCEKSICAYADNGDGQRFDYCPNCGAKMDGHKKEGLRNGTDI